MASPAAKTGAKQPKARTRRKPSKKAVARKKRNNARWALAASAIILLGALLLPRILRHIDPTTGAVAPEGFRHFVLDLSHHNGKEVRWDSLKVVLDAKGRTIKDLQAAKAILPVRHVVLKATEGETMKDENFARWWAEAGQATYSRGAYHFFRSSRNPRKQAQNYIKSVQLSHRDLPPVLDIESVHDGCTKEELNRNALLWLQTVEEHYGRVPIVYTSDAFARDWLSPEIRERYPLWIARYNRKAPRTKGWVFWQFTDRAVVYGIRGPVDLSVF